MDVIVIGGGSSGKALAKAWIAAGLQVTVVDMGSPVPDNWAGEWLAGKGVISTSGLVAVLDPRSGDERRLLQAKAIVLAVGKLDPLNRTGMIMGITKLGAAFTPEKTHIVCNERGETGAAAVYVTGSCAQQPTPAIVESLLNTTSLAER